MMDFKTNLQAPRDLKLADKEDEVKDEMRTLYILLPPYKMETRCKFQIEISD